MKEDLEIVIDIEKKRYAVLYEIWKVGKDDLRQGLHIDTIKEEGIISEQEVIPIICYLRDEGLTIDNNLWLQLTHRGLVEIERSIKNPENARVSDELCKRVSVQRWHSPFKDD
jgi:hypothetical protein